MADFAADDADMIIAVPGRADQDQLTDHGRRSANRSGSFLAKDYLTKLPPEIIIAIMEELPLSRDQSSAGRTSRAMYALYRSVFGLPQIVDWALGLASGRCESRYKDEGTPVETAINMLKVALRYGYKIRVDCFFYAIFGNKKGLGRGGDMPRKFLLDHMAALHHAAFNGLTTIATILLEHGAAIDVKSDWGVTPLEVAIEAQQVPMAKLLIRKGALVDGHYFHLACSTGNLDLIRLLIRPDLINSQWEGRTPLSIGLGSEFSARRTIVMFLLQSGATLQGLTAAEMSRVRTIKALEKGRRAHRRRACPL
ncbi:ankyrin repeat-containing domain protein [Diplogelasinospora grovesii]|uniref:Ankyrin repeat-containing domain protein n=1 Tax=Diplogelasinospora grovesii TaxID=303347 RepID=A0AAN6N1T3_9PEZI|nr:ankyrin repeat-containing domain protein [Diplogelasinospora grovesii]